MPTEIVFNDGWPYLTDRVGGDVADSAIERVTLPPMIVFILAQKYFIEGVAASGVKG